MGLVGPALGGVVFAIEELSRRLEQRSSGLMVAAIVVSGLVSVSVFGNLSYFGRVRIEVVSWWALWWPALLPAVLCGLLGGLMASALVASLVSRMISRPLYGTLAEQMLKPWLPTRHP